VSIDTFAGNFPFYGGLTFSDKTHFPEDVKMPEGNGIWLEQTLATIMGAKIGEEIKVGNHFFKIEKIVTDDTGQVFAMGTIAYKVYMSAKSFLERDFLQNGSTLTYLHHIKLKNLNDSEVEKLTKKIDKELVDPAVQVMSYHNVSDQITKGLQYLFDFLSLSTLISLILAALSLFFLGLGKYSSQKKNYEYLFEQGFYKKDVAKILRFEFLILQLIAAPASLAIFYLLAPLLEAKLLRFTNLPITLYQMIPYLAVVVVSQIFNQLVYEYLIQSHYHQSKKTGNIILSCFGILLFILAVLLSHSWIIGLVFSIALTISLFILWPSTTPLLKILQFFEPKTKYPISYFIKSLTRFAKETRLQIGSLAFALSLLILVSNLEKSLLLEFSGENKELFRPDYFAFDIQEEQIPAIEKLISDFNGKIMALSPLIRARITDVNNKAYEKVRTEATTREEERELRMKNRGANISYRSELDPSEEIIEGKYFSDSYDATKKELPEISLEKRYAERMGLKLNDTVTINVLDVPIKTTVTSIRKIRWTSFRPNFFISMQPGVLDDAPKSYLTGIGGLDPKKKLDFQAALFKLAPNVSSLEVNRLLEKIGQLLMQMSLALKIMAFLIFMQGLLLFIAAGANKLWQRRQEFLTLRLIGIPRAIIFLQFFFDIIILVCSSSLLALLIGTFISFCILKYAMLLPLTNALLVDYKSLLMLLALILALVIIPMLPILLKIVNRPVQDLIAE
jgi:putative ABC transport system permease protein